MTNPAAFSLSDETEEGVPEGFRRHVLRSTAVFALREPLPAPADRAAV